MTIVELDKRRSLLLSGASSVLAAHLKILESGAQDVVVKLFRRGKYAYFAFDAQEFMALLNQSMGATNRRHDRLNEALFQLAGLHLRQVARQPGMVASQHFISAGRKVPVSRFGVKWGQSSDTSEAPVQETPISLPKPSARRGKPRTQLEAVSKPPPATDEGRAPVRYPSISASATLQAGQAIVIIVDLPRSPSKATKGGALDLGQQPDEWTSLTIGVTLVSAGIVFKNGGRGKITVQRNRDSISARIAGTVGKDLKAGDAVDIHAQFWEGTRNCGVAKRRFKVDGKSANRAAVAGKVCIPVAARQPDISVYITLFDPSAPGRLHWRCITQPIAGLPPKLSGSIDLGNDPATEAVTMFRTLSAAAPGSSKTMLDAFGDHLWKKAPALFRDTYWALHDHHKRSLTIQFISEDPYLPWEFMRPSRGKEVQEPLALKHAVARWISDYQSFMRPDLPTGDTLVIAPHYNSASQTRAKAEAAARTLGQTVGAVTVQGTRKKLMRVLEKPPAKDVALLYFSGHGVMRPNAAATSTILLEDGDELSALEVNRTEVCLGDKFGSVVFLNACGVGATASSLGAVGGWASAFTERNFRAFIAPLWDVEEEHAATVAQQFVEKVVQDKQSIGEALRDIRYAGRNQSATFYAYLLFGDVHARFGA